MNGRLQGTLEKNTLVAGRYRVLLCMGVSAFAESYRVLDEDGSVAFLKLLGLAQLSQASHDKESELIELKIAQSIEHPNVARFLDSGELLQDGKKFLFMVFEYVVGESLHERIARETFSMIYDVKQLIAGVLEGLKYLHGLPNPIIHNDLSPTNILIDMSTDVPEARIADFGHARYFLESSKVYDRVGLNPHYVATECFHNIFSPQSDIYSVGAILYQMIYGLPPWFRDISRYEATQATIDELFKADRKKPLHFPEVADSFLDYDKRIEAVIRKALHSDLNIRFQSAAEFLETLEGEMEVDLTERESGVSVEKGNVKPRRNAPPKGKGFSAIAGMTELKEQLRIDVINAIENPEEYRKHNLGLPNGMLLYGPPGCGKTFFAERFAEEAGYNFIKVISSDLASIYVHGSQEKIGKLFRQAREQAPTILYFDELDAMVPNREKVNNQSQSGEVNEFLSQLDNIGNSGVFVIGSTNKPNAIDKAVLRAGRLEKWFFIPPPDHEARRAMFELYLETRPLDFGIDYDRLANLTENYVSSDIKLLVDEASRKTIREGLRRITMKTLEHIIQKQRPTVAASELRKYIAIRDEVEGRE